VRAIAKCLVVLLSISFAGCATHYMGRVVDTRGHPIAYARILGTGIRGGMITGEKEFACTAIADAGGHFDLVSSDWPDVVSASSPDSKLRGEIGLAMHKPPYVIVVQ
jgi:hypothetical protein